MRALMLITLALAIGCGDKANDTGEPDGDGDGFGISEDCDDTDPDIHPDARPPDIQGRRSAQARDHRGVAPPAVITST